MEQTISYLETVLDALGLNKTEKNDETKSEDTQNEDLMRFEQTVTEFYLHRLQKFECFLGTERNFTDLKTEYHVYAQKCMDAYRSDSSSIKQKRCKKSFLSLVKNLYSEHYIIKITLCDITLKTLQILRLYHNNCEVSEGEVSQLNEMMKEAVKEKKTYWFKESSDDECGLKKDEAGKDFMIVEIFSTTTDFEHFKNFEATAEEPEEEEQKDD